MVRGLLGGGRFRGSNGAGHSSTSAADWRRPNQLPVKPRLTESARASKADAPTDSKLTVSITHEASDESAGWDRVPWRRRDAI